MTLMFQSDIPKFELYNSNILPRPSETSLSHLNYYICNFSKLFIANVRPILKADNWFYIVCQFIGFYMSGNLAPDGFA